MSKRKKKRQTKKLAFGKKCIIGLFINCAIIQTVTLGLMIYMVIIAPTTSIIDFSPLNALISTVVVECISYISYNWKSSKENTKGGVTYAKALKEIELSEGIDG